MFGFLRKKEKSLQSPVGGGWHPIREAFPGAWQMNIEISADNVSSFYAVFACITLIASDIAKLPLLLKRKGSNKIWQEISTPKLSKLLKKPNNFQTRIQFFEHWLLSLNLRGNTYVLKIRNNKGDTVQWRILDPDRVRPLVTDDGDVYYELSVDNISGIKKSVTVPASEIIHDRFNCLFHPLVGLSPIFACGLSATQGKNIQENSTRFFANGSQPGGILLVPGSLSTEKANELKENWATGYSGKNSGKTAVLADGVTYKQISISAADSQMVEQLKMSAEVVCSAFHVPKYKIAIGDMPANSNVEALDQQYYSQCLQVRIESIELLIDEGLELDDQFGVEFDLKSLLRMDTATRYKAHSDGVKGGWIAPNEVRKEEGLPPVEGGDSPYLQQQNFSLEALSRRDSQSDPFSTTENIDVIENEEKIEEQGKLFKLIFEKELANNEITRA